MAKLQAGQFARLANTLLRNLPVIFSNRLRLDRIMIMSLWPAFWPTMYTMYKRPGHCEREKYVAQKLPSISQDNVKGVREFSAGSK